MLAARFESRTRPRTSSPRSSSAEQIAYPTLPVAPVTSTRMAGILCGSHGFEDLLGELRAVARIEGRAHDPDDHLVVIELLDRDVGRVAKRHRDRLLEHVLDFPG